jgi:hypothetical protein
LRFVHVYLIGYFLLVFGAGLALWRAGILERVSPLWSGLTVLVAVVIGLLFACTSATAVPVAPVPTPE